MSDTPPFQSHKITVDKTAHYYTLGQAGPEIDYLWMACHGYGQLASNLIRKFTAIDDGKSLIVAPEGLSRMYWPGLGGVPGASWMTRADRLDEIADYTRYLRTIYDYFQSQLKADVKVILFGFSQGCATQIRWMMREQPDYHALILWAGLLPDDLDYRPHQAYFNRPLYWLYGQDDEFLTPKRLQWQKTFAQKMQLNLESITFEGRHEVDREVLSQLYQRIQQNQ
ncbi:MAG: phospholipase [Bacteroidota bacterium]